MDTIIILRAEMLGSMDLYVRETIGDDLLTDIWNCDGVPDGADEIDILEIASDEEQFANICGVFHKTLVRHGILTEGE